MADIVKINKNIQYQTNSVLYGLLAGETKPLEFINKNFASHIIDAYLKDGTFELFPSNEEKQEVPVLDNAEIDLNPIETTQIDVSSQDTSTVDTSAQDNDNAQNQTQSIDTQPIQDADATINTAQPQDGNEADTQDNTQPQVFEIMYKTTQPIQDKDGNEIEVGSQFTESELKELIVVDQRKSNKKIKELLQDEKLIELKIVK
jgi:hypothetical protein